MSNTVDNRVVEMRFDNAQFEKGVKDTIASLNDLKQALQFNSASVNLNTVQKAIDKFSLDNIADSLDYVASKFTFFGQLGLKVMNNIGDAVLNLGSKLASISIGQIITGGKGRAQKVADARFKLDGLLKDAEKVQSAFDSASKAVDGTAYGLDSAVSIASQLAASNVQLGEDMDSALRGVAGLAAMTGSSFEDMGNIFATVAGNGRLMGMQLTQISSRGINVAAELAKQMNKTEGEIREMVSKGEISFKQFAGAMEKAFGDQAAKANETLTGALDNVRAALSRIGEIFYSGIIENKDFIKFINDIRIAINGVKKAMEPLKEPFKALITSASKLGSAILRLFNVDNGFTGMVDTIAGALTKASEFIDIFTAKINGIADRISGPLKAVQKVAKETSEVTSVVTEDIRKLADEVWMGKHGNGAARIADLGEEVYNQVQPYVNAMKQANFDLAKADEIYAQMVAQDAETVKEAKKDEKEATEEAAEASNKAVKESSTVNKIVSIISTTLWTIKKSIAAVGNAFKKVFSKDKLVKQLKNIVDALYLFSRNLELTDKRASKLEDIFTGVFAVIEMVASAIGNFIAGSLKILGPILSVILDIILDIFSAIGKVINSIRNWIQSNKLLTSIGEKIVSIFTKVANVCKRFYEGFVNLPAVKELTSMFKTFLKDVAEKLLIWFNDAADATDKFFDNFEDKDADPINVVLGGINTALSTFIDLAKEGKKNFSKAFDWVTKKVDELKELGTSIADVFGGIENIKEAGEAAANSKGPLDFIDNLSKSFGNLGDKFTGVVEKITEKIKNLDTAKIALFGLSSGITAFLFSISAFLVKSGKLVEAFTALPRAIINTLNSIGQAIRDLKKFFMLRAETKLILAIAAAIAVLVGSIYLLSKIPERQLIVAASAMAVLIVVLEVMIGLLGSLAKNSAEIEGYNKTLWSFAATMVALGIAIAALAYSIKKITEVDWSKLNSWAGLGVLIVMIGALAGAALLLSHFAPVLSMGGLGIIAFSASIYILVGALNKLNEFDATVIDSIKDRMDILCKAMIAVGAVALLAGRFTFSGGMGILVVIASIYLIEKELQWLITNGVSLEKVKQNMDKLWPVIIALVGIGAYIVLVSQLVKDVPRVTSLLVGTALSLLIITLALKSLMKVASNDLAAYYAALFGLMGIIALMGLLIYTAAQTAQAARIKRAGTMMVQMGWALILISAAVAIVANIPDDKIVQGMVCIGLLIALMGGLIYISKFGGNMNAKAILAMVAVVATLTLFVALMSYMDDIISVLAAMGIIGLSLIAFGISMRLATRYINKNTERGIVAMLAVLTITIFGLTVLSQVIGNNGISGVLAAAGAISAVLVFFGIAMAVMGKTFKGVQTDVLKNRMKMVEVFTATLAVIMLGLTAVLTTGASWSSMLAAAGSIIGVLFALVGAIAVLNLVKVKPGEMEGKAAAFLLVSLSLIPIALALRMIAGYKWEDMKGPLLAMVAVIAIVAIALAGLTALSKSGVGLALILGVAGALAIVMLAAAASMFIFAKAMLKVIAGLKKLTTIQWENIRIDILSQMVILLLKLVGIVALAGVSLVVFGAGLLAIAPGLTLIAFAIGLVISAATKFIKVFTPFVKLIKAFIDDAKNVSKNIDILTDSLTRFIINLSQAFAIGVRTFLATLAANIMFISTSLKLILLTIVKDVLEANIQIAEMIFAALVEIAKYIAEKLPELLEALNDILITTLKSIAENSFAYGYYGSIIAIEFAAGLLSGLADAIPDLVNAATLAALSVIKATAETFDKYKGTIGKTALGLYAKGSEKYYRKKQKDAEKYELQLYGKVLETGESARYKNIADELEEEAKTDLGSIDEEIALYKEQAQQQVDAQTEAYKSVDTSNAEEAASNTMGKAASAGYTSIVEDIRSMASGLKQDVKDTATDMLSGGSEAIEETEKVQKAQIRRYITGLPAEARHAMEEELSKQGWTKGAGDYMYKMIDVDEAGNKITENVSETMGKIPTEALEAMEKNGYKLNETGTQIIKGVSDGAEDEAEGTDISSIFTSLMNGDEVNSKFNSDGEDAFSNWLGGVDTIADDPFNKNKMTKHGIDYANLLNNGFTSKDGIDSNSPSKKSARFAGYWIDGLILTLQSTKRQNEVNNASISIATGMMNSFNSAMNTASTMDAFQPTIAPVLDDQNMRQYSGVLNTLTNPATMKLAADSTMTVQNSDQARLAQQIDALSKEVNALANKDISEAFKEVQFNVNANTSVDGKVLRKTSAAYTIDQIDRKERAIIMSKGGRA